MRSSNPVFRTIERSEVFVASEQATYTGIVMKTSLLLLTAVISGFLAINFAGEALYPLLIVSLFTTLISVMIATRSLRLARFFSFVYALSEGVLLGVITYMFNTFFPGIAYTAILGTASIFTVMLFLYSSRTIRVTNRFKKVMYGILMGFLLFFVASLIINLISPFTIVLSDSVALLVSGVIIIFGALMLAIDFDRAETIVSGGFDKQYEWVVSVVLMVTLIWIYIELLRFLAIIASNRN